MEGGEMGEEPRGSTPPPSPTTRRNVLAVALGAAKMLPPALTTSVNPGASVGMLTHRPRAHAPDLFRVYSPSLCLKRHLQGSRGSWSATAYSLTVIRS